MIRTALISIGILASSIGAPAQTYNVQTSGTPEQRAACGPDVRRLCRSLKDSDGPFAYLQCFQTNHTRLSARCLGMLQSYGLYF